MKITKEIVEYAAALSKLTLTDEECERQIRDMGSIIAYMDKLGELDTSDLEAMSHTFPLKNAFREDTVKQSMNVGELLSVAPEHDEEYYIVPRTVE